MPIVLSAELLEYLCQEAYRRAGKHWFHTVSVTIEANVRATESKPITNGKNKGVWNFPQCKATKVTQNCYPFNSIFLLKTCVVLLKRFWRFMNVYLSENIDGILQVPRVSERRSLAEDAFPLHSLGKLKPWDRFPKPSQGVIGQVFGELANCSSLGLQSPPFQYLVPLVFVLAVHFAKRNLSSHPTASSTSCHVIYSHNWSMVLRVCSFLVKYFHWIPAQFHEFPLKR